MIDEMVKQIDYMERVFYDAYLRCHYMKEGLKQIPGQYQVAPPMVQPQGTQQMNPEPTLQTQQAAQPTPLTVQQQPPPQMQQPPPQMQQPPPPQGTPQVQQQTGVNTAPKYGFRTAEELRQIAPNDEWFRLVGKSEVLFGVTPESPEEQRELERVYHMGIEGIGTFNRNGNPYHFSQRMIRKIS